MALEKKVRTLKFPAIWKKPFRTDVDFDFMQIRNAIEAKLNAGLAPKQLEVVDNSYKHAGHAGAHPEGESHFAVTVVSDAFVGKSRVQRQRMVYDLLAEEMAARIHALELKTLTADEAQG